LPSRVRVPAQSISANAEELTPPAGVFVVARLGSRPIAACPAEALIAGSVAEVAEQFRTFGKIGYTDILVRHLTNDQPKVLDSLERLAAVRVALA